MIETHHARLCHTRNYLRIHNNTFLPFICSFRCPKFCYLPTIRLLIFHLFPFFFSLLSPFFFQIYAAGDAINVEKYSTCWSFFACVSTIGTGLTDWIWSTARNATSTIIANTSPDAVASQSIGRLLVSQFICSANRLVPHLPQPQTGMNNNHFASYIFIIFRQFCRLPDERKKKRANFIIEVNNEHVRRTFFSVFFSFCFVYSWRDVAVKRLNAWMAAMRQK